MSGELNLLEYAIKANRNERVYICEQEFAVFAMYYFAEFFTYKIPGFHWNMYAQLNEFTRGKFRFLLWVMFRESGKTTIAKVYAIYCIAYRKKRFINWDAYDKGNSEAALFDIVTWLQTNRKILSDFGQLFYEEPKQTRREAHMKRIGEFITTNRVKVKAYSTQESTRGRIFDRFRPDLYVLEDFETIKTTESVPITAKIIKHMDEMKAGLSVDGQVLFLANYISEVGSVAMLLQEAKENTASWRHLMVSVEEGGTIVWPDKYVETNAEAAKLNEGRSRGERVVSLEQLRKDLNTGGRKIFEAEMLNSPEAAGEPFFDREKVDRGIVHAKTKKPIRIVGGLSIWEEYIARNRYAFGGDTSKGVSRDACASVGVRFAQTTAVPARVVATYASNTIPPDLFGDEMAAHGRIFGECLLAPELNNTGFATVTRLKAIYPQGSIYRQVKQDQLGNNITRDLGWEATLANVATIYYNFRSAYEAGEVEVFCPVLLAEMRSFTKRDLESASKRAEQRMDGTGLATRHFDMLRAACIAWDMRTHAIVGKAGRKPYRQADPERMSDYQG